MLGLPLTITALMITCMGVGLGALSLLLYAFFAADRDGYAFLQYFSSIFPNFKFTTRALFLFLYVLASLKHIKIAKKLDPRINALAIGIQALTFYVFIAAILKGYGLLEALSFVVYSGTPAFLIWIAYTKPRGNLDKLFLFVFFQLILSILVLSTPSLYALDGATYKAEEGIYVAPSSGLNYQFPIGSEEKHTIGRYAQFHNPNALGFYSVVALGLGLCLIFSRQKFSTTTTSLVFLAIGTLGWLNSLSRGPIALLAIGALIYLIFRSPGKPTSNRLPKRVFTLFTVAATTVTLAAVIWSSDFFLPSSSSTSVSWRLLSYIEGFDAINAHPIIGIPSSWHWTTIEPHLLSISFAANFGLPAGLLISLIVYAGGSLIIFVSIIRQRRGIGKEHENALSIFLISIIWGVSFTNNLTAPILFWLCFAQASMTSLSRHENFPNKVKRERQNPFKKNELTYSNDP